MEHSNSSRRPSRADWWQYHLPGAYFVTIRVESNSHLLSSVQHQTIELSPVGKIINEIWHAIPEQFPGVQIDTHVIMPDHVHGIVVITQPQNPNHDGNPMTGELNLGKIIRWFKGRSTFEIRKAKHLPFSWQRSYYDRIIRDSEEHKRIQEYIVNNPMKWSQQQA